MDHNLLTEFVRSGGAAHVNTADDRAAVGDPPNEPQHQQWVNGSVIDRKSSLDLRTTFREFPRRM
jgi:hypothetical protein